MTKSLDAAGIVFTVFMFAAWLLLTLNLYGIFASGPLRSCEARYSRAWELIWAYALACLVWLFLGLTLYRLHLPGGWWV